jgi:hypothetical protein
MTTVFDKHDPTIDSRDVIARIEELKAEWSEATEGENSDDYSLSEDDWSVGLGEDGAAEMVALLALAKEGADNFSDWVHGETLIRDSYFKEYAQELADDIGAIKADAGWPLNCIDWEQAARELRMDYTSVEFGDVTYWGRS